ncbi:diguanylate cyclase [Nautilia profundicola AmH]|uniref:diguanylate cyclase n=1 Tax=Nautilia profundicola (strain ATCC BAA-1463 / DSM 18972 / AmH) TaxID=598659 RepID=B9LA95_NAUPA|nr:diguanylate cyclase [Nautilia profundicola]ACM93567.1 diguanylate cyclase [Nautilia profundicola AmH]
MSDIFSNKRTLYIVIFMHTLFFALALMLLSYEHKKNLNNYLNDLYDTKYKIYMNQLKVLNQHTDLLKSLLVDEKVLKIIANAQRDFNGSREKLIKQLYPKYEILKKYGVYQFHFHLPGGISFVRFHHLDKFGEKLYPYRPSIKYVQTTLKPYHGFETGKMVSGFRNVYPLIYNGKLVGSMEISFSMKKLVQYIFEKEYLAMVVKKEILKNKLFPDAWSNYKVCKLNPNYYICGNICILFKHYHNIDFNQKANIVENKLVLSYPLYNVEKKHEGFMLSVIPLDKIETLNEINNSYNTLIIIVFLIYVFLLGVMLFLYNYSKMKRNSQIDYLTDILNRSGCLSKIKALDDYSVLVLDVDHFKQINDTYGHNVGDEILKRFVDVVRNTIRKNDIFCRWGGEEFVIILPDTDKETAKLVAEKIRKTVENTDFDNLKITVSIGVAQKEKNFNETFKIADMKLYEAKELGRNRVVA